MKVAIDAMAAVTPRGAGGCLFLRNLSVLDPERCFDEEISRVPAKVFEPLRERYSSGALRRMDPYARLALLGACLCAEESGWGETTGENTALVLGSDLGAVSSIEGLFASIHQAQGLTCSPTFFANSLHNSAASQIATGLGILGPSLTVTQLEATLPAVLDLASILLYDPYGPASVLTGVVEEASEYLSKEGAVFFLLSRPTGMRGELCLGIDFDCRDVNGEAEVTALEIARRAAILTQRFEGIKEAPVELAFRLATGPGRQARISLTCDRCSCDAQKEQET